MSNKVVILKTHIWSKDLEIFAHKIYCNCYDNGIDFFIIMHAETDNLLGKIESDIIKGIVYRVTEDQIKNLYSKGFISMWLSNHWLLMWFYRNFGQKYDYIWSIEYDVRISGKSEIIWTCAENWDFMFVLGNYVNRLNVYNDTYTGNNLSENEKYHGYLQISRYSQRALAYLDECFQAGENGQDEIIIFSLMNRGKFSMSNKFLKTLVSGAWTWKDKFAPYNKQMYDAFEALGENNPHIFHPVK